MYRNRIPYPWLIIILAGWLLASVHAAAQSTVPQLLSYQGVLSDPQRTAVPDGQYNVTFRIYDAETGGTVLWEETNEVETVSGIFDVVLGTKTPLTLPFDAAYWFALELQGEPEMAPRIRFVSTPYAFRALSADMALQLDPNAEGVVHSINDLDGQVTLIGEGQASVTTSGNVISIVVPEVLPLNPVDGQTIRWNEATGVWEAADIAVAATPRLTGDGSPAAPLDIAQMGAADGQPLTWNAASEAWQPGEAAVKSASPLRGDGTSAAPLSLEEGSANGQIFFWDGTAWSRSASASPNDRDALVWDAVNGQWTPAPQQIVASEEIAGDGTAASPLRLGAQGATNGQVLRWDDASAGWRPGPSVDVLVPPLRGTGAPGDPIGFLDGEAPGQLLFWDGTAWIHTASVAPNDGELLRWDAADGLWKPEGIAVTGSAPLTHGSVWYGDAADKAAELAIGSVNQVMTVNEAGTLPVWSSDLTVDSISAVAVQVQDDAVIDGDLTVNGTDVTLPNGSIDNEELANDSINVSYGAGLAGDAAVALGGTLNVQNTGVTSLTGTANQVIVDQSTGDVVLSTPQDIHADAVPTFDGLTLDNLSAGSTSQELIVSNGGSLETRTFGSLHPGGVLPLGTSANTTLRWDGTSWVENTNVTTDATGNLSTTGDGVVGGDLTVNGTAVTLPAGSVENVELANSSVSVAYGTGLSGDVSVSLGGTLNVQNTGVTSLTGTANQVLVDQSTGAVTLSTPQDIHANATPTFGGLTLDNLSGGSASQDIVVSNGGSLETRTLGSLHPGGVLPLGTSANTTLRWDGTSWVENTNVTTDASGNTSAAGAATIGGDLTVNGTVVTLPAGSVDNAELANSSVSVAYGTGLSGDASVSLGGTLNVQNTGVTSLIGTANQVIVDQSTGAVTLSTPQDIHTNATPTFDGLTLDNLSAGSTSQELLVSNGGLLETRTFGSLHPGGVLPLGTSANTTLRWDGTSWVENTNVTSDATGNLSTTGDGIVGGDLTVNGTGVTLPGGSVDNSELANSSVSVSYGTGLSGDGSVSLGGTLNIQNTGVTEAQAGTGIIVDQATGTVTITNTGVTSLTGTANQVVVDQSTGAVTLSTPQDIHTNATPTFDGLTLDNLSGGSTSQELIVSNGGSLETRAFGSLHPGGVLPAGTSPNATLRWDGTGWVENTNVRADATGNLSTAGDGVVGGDLTVNGTAVTLPAGSVDNAELANSSVSVAYGTGLSGDASVSLGGTLNVQNTGVTSLIGTANQVIVDQSTGAVTLSTPQDIHTNATPTFDGLTLDNLSGGSASQDIVVSNGGSLETRTLGSLHPGGILPLGTSANTTLRWDGTGWVENTNVTSDASGNTSAAGAATIGGDLTVNGAGVTLPGGSVDNSELANSSVSVAYGTGLSGDASVALGGTLNVQNTGVTSLVGTANQVLVDQSTGAVTLSTPQDIHANATPTFGGLTLDNLSGGSASQDIVVSNGGSLETRTLGSLHPGGVLPAGTSPNTTLRWDGTGWVENTSVTTDASGNTSAAGAATIGGDLTVNGTGVTLPAGSVDNSELANSSVSVSYGTGLSGDGSVSLGGTLNIQNTGVTSLVGTANQVVVDQSTGAVTLSTPQDIHTNATPTFDGLTLDNLSGGSASQDIVVSNGGSLETRTLGSLHPGGVLPLGTSANTTLRWDGTSWVENTNVTSDASGNTSAAGAATIGGDLTVNGTGVTLPAGSVDNSELANSSVSVAYGTGLSGDASVALGGTLNIQNTGVTSLTGTANQVVVDQSTGAVTLSTPQDIHTNATPTFDGLTLDNLSGGSASQDIVVSNGGLLETRTLGSLHPGGVLPLGTSANTTLRWDGTSWVENTNVRADATGNLSTTGDGVVGGDLTVNGTGVTLPAGSVDNAELANSTINVAYGTGLSGDASVALGGTLNVQNTGVTEAQAGVGIIVDQSTGTVTITNTGVTSLTGTANQVLVDQSTGAVTLSTPQNIHTNATPTFDGLTLDNLSGGSASQDIVVSNGGSLETRTLGSLHPGGVLPLGTSANTTLRWDGTKWVENTNVRADATGNLSTTGDGVVGGDLTVNGTAVTLPAGSVDNAELANSTINVAYGTGLSGDASVALGGTLNVQNTGVTSLVGTANQVLVDQSTGAVTLSTPQDIHTNATPTFDGLTLDNMSGGSTSQELIVSNSGLLETRTLGSLHPGGVLPLGTSPNTTLRWDGTGWVENTNVTSDASGNVNAAGNSTVSGDLTVNGTAVTLPAGSVDNVELANSSVSVAYGTGLSGDASVSLGGTLNLQNTGVTEAQAGTGINVDQSTGTVTITNTGVTSLVGTANQVLVDQSTGAVTLSTPQDIHTNATPTFDGLTLDNLSGGSASQDIVVSNGGSLETRTLGSLHPGGVLPLGTSANTTLRWNGTAWIENTNVTSDASGNTSAAGAATIGGDLTVNGTVVTLPAGSVDNAELANSTVNVSYGTGLSGDGSVSLGGTLNLQNTGVTEAQAGTGIIVDQSTGTVTITNTGVTSLTGTANQVLVDQSTGAVTLSTPQDIHTNATPTFDGLRLDNMSGGSTSQELIVSNGGTLETRTFGSLHPGGILPAGTSPNATLRWDGIAWIENTNVTSDVSGNVSAAGNSTVSGDLTVNGTAVTLPAGSVDNVELANSSVSVSYGTGLSGDASVSLGGTLNVQNTGVTSLTGTANQVVVDQSTGVVTLSTPQDIHTNAMPTFDGLTLDNLSGGSASQDIVVSNGGSLETRTFGSLHPGGILPAGTSPNTTLRWDGTSWVENTNVTSDASGNTSAAGAATIGGDLTVNGTAVALPAGSVDNSELANSSVSVSYGTGLSGDASVSLGGTLSVQNTGVTEAQAGTGINVDQSTGTVTITNTGVTSLTGTANQVVVDQSTGAVTLSTPQDIHTNATPTFDGLTLDNLSAGSTSDILLVSNGGTIQSRTIASLASEFDTEFWITGGNAGTTPGTHFLGTTDNQPFQIHVDNANSTATNGRGRVMRYEPNNTSANIIGGFKSNTVVSGTVGATISGGGRNGNVNSISADYGVIAGGYSNLIETGATNGVISGGINHEIRSSSSNSVIAGGNNNEIQASTSVISGGASNTIAGSASNSVIGGGTSNNIAASSSTSVIAGGSGHTISSTTSFIGGGDLAAIGTNSRWSAVIAGHNNHIADNSFESIIGAGEGNDIGAGSVRGTVSGGSFNDIGTNASNSTIGGGYGNGIQNNADRSTVNGGMSNVIRQGASIGTIGGGFNNVIDTSATQSTIGGGNGNFIDNTNSTVGGGSTNAIRQGANGSTISGGVANTIDTSATNAVIGGGTTNLIDNSANSSVIAGGQGNTITSAYSTVLGGRGMTLGASGTLGFLGNNNSGGSPMTISTANVVTFGNADVWLANNDNSASALRFYEANSTTGAFPGTTNYSSFEAQPQTADIRYILPDTAGITGDVLAVKSVSGTQVTLDWKAQTAPNISDSAWSKMGNSGTTAGAHFIGTTDDEPFQIHVDNANANGTNGRGRVMRFEPNATSANIIAGFSTNSVAGGSVGATISGGGQNGGANTVGSNYSTIGGGTRNVIGASSVNATISGGLSNRITASAGNGTIAGGMGNQIVSGDHTTISGGFNNAIQTGSFGTTISGGTNNQASSHTSVIGGGNANVISTSAQFSTIGGGNSNSLGSGAISSTISGGVNDTIEASSTYSTIGGGQLNAIRSTAPYSSISGGYDNEIGSGAYRSTIGGGYQNAIGTNARWSTIGGGEQNYINAISSTIAGGTHDTIEASAQNAFIGGGDQNYIRQSSRFSSVVGGRSNEASTGADFSFVGGGESNVVNADDAVVAGGRSNTVAGDRSVIPGGRGLTLSGSGSFGFLGNNVGSNDMTVSDVNTAVFGNTDLWLANNDNGASALRFYEANNTAGAFPGTTNYSSFEAQTQAADIRYILPDTAGITGDVLAVASVSGTQVTLDWSAGGGSSINVSDSAWSKTGNAGTTAGTHFIGTTDDEPFQIHVDNAGSTATNGRGRVMRFEPNATSANIIVGFKSNSIAAGVVGGTIGGGGRNGGANTVSSNYSTISGGSGNAIGTSSINATISGGVSNQVGGSAGNGTISGGLGNVITSGDHTTIGGGFNNQIQTGSFGSTIDGGTNNRLASHTSVIGGGNGHSIGTSAQFSTISGGMSDSIEASAFSSVIGGGESNVIRSAAPYSTIGGGYDNEIGSGATRSTISGGYQNVISGSHSAIAGGRGLTISGTGSFGFLGGNTAGANPMTMSTNNTAVFGNTDLWLANNDNAAGELRFYEANGTAGAFPGTTNYTALKAGTQGADITYTLPTAAPAVDGQVLSSTTTGTMSWQRPNTLAHTARGANYAMSSTDIIVGATAVGITITLPAANSVPAGTWVVVKDQTGTASGAVPGTTDITVSRTGTDTIDGAATISISTVYGSVRLYSNGVGAWFVM